MDSSSSASIQPSSPSSHVSSLVLIQSGPLCVPLLRLSLLQLELIHQALAGKSGITGVLWAGKALSVVAVPDGAGQQGKGRHKEIEEPVSRTCHFSTVQSLEVMGI